MLRRFWFLALLVLACSPVPRPAVLEEADRTRGASAQKEAERLAPQAFLAAEKLRADAERALAAADRAGAQILGEHALAAYAHAAVLARLAKADQREAQATQAAAKAQAEYSALEAEQERVAAEANDAELRYRVARDALPVAESEPSSGEREQARLAAARALGLEARLLCVARQMLAPDTESVTAAFKALDALDLAMDKKPVRAPIDEAVRLRSTCLSELSGVRRSATRAAPEAGVVDALLDELSKAALEPRRDDRGIAVTLRDAFQGAALTSAARARVEALGQIGKAHPTFPILVVSHAARGKGSPRDAARADAVKTALVGAGAARVEARAAGDAAPVALPKRADSAGRNERIEIVFVAPSQ